MSGPHNTLAPRLVRELVKGTADHAGFPQEAEAMVVLESVILGVMLLFRPDPYHAAEYLDVMTAAVIERMKPNA